ncbi:hypothetical protein ACFQ3Z_44705 [Streptomyces nogalater]
MVKLHLYVSGMEQPGEDASGFSAIQQGSGTLSARTGERLHGLLPSRLAGIPAGVDWGYELRPDPLQGPGQPGQHVGTPS